MKPFTRWKTSRKVSYFWSRLFRAKWTVIFITINIVPGSTVIEEGLINPEEKRGAEFKGIVWSVQLRNWVCQFYFFGPWDGLTIFSCTEYKTRSSRGFSLVETTLEGSWFCRIYSGGSWVLIFKNLLWGLLIPRNLLCGLLVIRNLLGGSWS